MMQMQHRLLRGYAILIVNKSKLHYKKPRIQIEIIRRNEKQVLCGTY